MGRVEPSAQNGDRLKEDGKKDKLQGSFEILRDSVITYQQFVKSANTFQLYSLKIFTVQECYLEL